MYFASRIFFCSVVLFFCFFLSFPTRLHTMSKLTQVLVLGAIIRFVLPTLIPLIPFKLSSIVEISTPINSFKSLQEAFYYLQHDINLYDGGVNHHPPLLVFALYQIDQYFPKHISLIVFNLLYTLLDLGVTIKLIQINRWYNSHHNKRYGISLALGFNDDLIASFYLFNPLVILTNLSHSTLNFSIFLIIESLQQLLVEQNFVRSLIALSASSYLSFSSVYLVVPLLTLAKAVNPDTESSMLYGKGFGLFFMASALLLVLSLIHTSSTQFLSCYTTVFKFDKISPNVGLWWYLFTEMFDYFRPFYIGVFNLYSAVFIIPIAMRLLERTVDQVPVGDSFLAFVLSYTWLSFSKSYPSVGDLALTLSMVPIFKNTVVPHCKFIFVTGLVLLVCLLLSPIFYYCWIVLGTGNSNFFYSINLIWGAVHALILLDLIWGRLTFDYIKTHKVPDLEKSSLRLTQI